MRDRGGCVLRGGGGGGGGHGVNCHYDKGYVMCYKQQNICCYLLLLLLLSFDSKLHVSLTAVAASDSLVAGGADADDRSSGGTSQMCSCRITALSSCCAGCAYVANL